MADSTAKGEAMQAVRLLYDDALAHPPHTPAQVETLYQARRLLEGFIEEHHALVLSTDDEDMTWEVTDDKSISKTYTIKADENNCGGVGWIGYGSYNKGEFIHTDYHAVGKIVVLDSVDKRVTVRFTDGSVGTMSFDEMKALNSKGSWKE